MRFEKLKVVSCSYMRWFSYFYYMKRFALGIFTWLFALPVAGQSPVFVFEHFGYEQGLSAAVENIVKGKDGFLWLGSSDGLIRFDGKNFTSYRNKRNDSLSIPNNIINCLYTDHNGNIWAATNGGLCYYDFASDVFRRFRFDFALEKIDRHRVYAITESSQKEIWFATRTHFYRIKSTGEIISFDIPGKPDNLIIKNLLFDSQKRLWIGTNIGLYVFYEQTGKFIHNELQTPFTIAGKLNVSCQSVFPYKGDTMLVPTWYGGVQLLYIQNETLFNIPVPDSISSDPRKYIIKSVTKDNLGRIWTGSYGNGISLCEMDQQKFSAHMQHDPAVPGSIGNDYINVMFTDETGITWIGHESGLDKFDPLTRQFSNVALPKVPGEFSIYRTPSAISIDRHDSTGKWMWVTVSGIGLLHYNRETTEFEVYRNDTTDTNSLADNNVRAIYYDNQNRLWIGSRTGACIFNPVTKSFQKVSFPNNMNPVSVNGFVQDKKGKIWLSTSGNGLYCYDEHADKISSWRYLQGNPRSLPDNFIFSMIVDHDDMIWLGTQNNGLCRLNPETGEFLFFMSRRDDPDALPDNGIFDLYEDAQNQLWIATENGIAKMDPVTRKMKTLTTEDGLSNNIVYSISYDDQGSLWFGTANGLCRYDPIKKTFKNFFTNDGLGSNRMDGAVYKSGGVLFFGSSGSINYCRPEQLKMNKRPPPIAITGIRIFDETLPLARTGGTPAPLKLSYRQSMITFEFAAMNFTNSFLNRYEYQLEGFDESWIPSGSHQSATYTNLPGGNYLFRVRAANNDGIWNETGASIRISVAPPFWKTWWFYLLCFIAAGAVLFGIYRVRVKQLMRLQHIRMRISRDLHDDIGSTLSSINMISSMAAKKQYGLQKTSEQLRTISSASGLAMELMNDIVWSVNPENDKMDMVFSKMRQYASGILEAAGIEFTLNMDEACSRISIPIEKRKDFYLIFKEAVNNLAKYSGATRVEISLNCRNKILQLEVSDNGKGITETTGTGGNGLKNMKARSVTLRGSLDIRTAPGTGTTIELKFPISP